jgi:hypothetical protein
VALQVLARLSDRRLQAMRLLYFEKTFLATRFEERLHRRVVGGDGVHILRQQFFVFRTVHAKVDVITSVAI